LKVNGAGETEVEILNSSSLDVEFHQDIKPIIDRSCASCHTGSAAPAGLVLDDDSLIDDYDGTWHRLANDTAADYGIPPLTEPYGWRQSNRSRYVRAFQSRRSLLIWKLYGERLDGWSNSDHPTETVRGDKTTLPGGGSNNEVNMSDIDFDGVACPPPGSGVDPLTEAEKLKFVRWIDLGAPISKPGTNGLGWFTDELRPILALSQPRAGAANESVSEIRLGLFDYYTGIDISSLSVKANFNVNGIAAGAELASDFSSQGDHIWKLDLNTPLQDTTGRSLDISIKDNAGNTVSVSRQFDVGISDSDRMMFIPVKRSDGKIGIILF